MKTLRITPMLALLVCLLCAGSVLADVTQEVGYLDLEWIAIPDDASEIKDIDLGPMLGDISKDAESKGDDALVQALAMVRSIRVKAYSVEDGGSAEAQATVDKVTANLKADDWKRPIFMKDDEETVSVNTKYDGEDLVGLLIIISYWVEAHSGSAGSAQSAQAMSWMRLLLCFVWITKESGLLKRNKTKGVMAFALRSGIFCLLGEL